MIGIALLALAEVPPTSPAGQSQAPVVMSGLAALAISLVVWPLVRFAITIAHEGGHAWTASMMGGRVSLIKVLRGGHGLTKYGGLSEPGDLLATLAGYLGPSVFGLLGAVLLVQGYVTAVLWLSLVFLFLALVQIRNLLGAVAIVATGAVLVLILRYASVGQRVFFAYTWIWCLLIGGFGAVLALQRARSRGTDTSSDAYELRKLTYLPAALWSGFFWLATLAALVGGAAILLGMVRNPVR